MHQQPAAASPASWSPASQYLTRPTRAGDTCFLCSSVQTCPVHDGSSRAGLHRRGHAVRHMEATGLSGNLSAAPATCALTVQHLPLPHARRGTQMPRSPTTMAMCQRSPALRRSPHPQQLRDRQAVACKALGRCVSVCLSISCDAPHCHCRQAATATETALRLSRCCLPCKSCFGEGVHTLRVCSMCAHLDAG